MRFGIPVTGLGLAALATSTSLALACGRSTEEWTVELGSRTAQASASSAPQDEEISPRLLRRFQPLDAPEPPSTKAKAAQIELGSKLFHDTELSADSSVSCASCHALGLYGADARPTSVGVGGKTGSRNAPTIVNASYQFRMFWDGRAGTLEEQAKMPILNPAEMGMPDAKSVVRALAGDPEYVFLFHEAFPLEERPITFDNYAIAVAAYERTLVTRSRWDDFLEGNESALTIDEKRGLKTFLNVGCITCHTGRMLGGSMYERAGAIEPWPNQSDQGRFELTKQESDRMVFKVPTLRNVAKTGPYFHDGSAKTLEEAVSMMGRYQLGLELESDEVASIVSWLNSLTGRLPEAGRGAR